MWEGLSLPSQSSAGEAAINQGDYSLAMIRPYLQRGSDSRKNEHCAKISYDLELAVWRSAAGKKVKTGGHGDGEQVNNYGGAIRFF